MRELLELLMRQQHDEDGVRQHHAGRRVVTEIRIPREAHPFVEGRGSGKVGHRQVDEHHLRHCMLSQAFSDSMLEGYEHKL